MTPSLRVPRRAFLAGLGLAASGLAIGSFAEAEPAKAVAAGAGFRPNVFVHVAPDGIVSIVCHRSEMGQGVRSSLPVLIADEIGADMARVRIIQGDGDKIYGDQNTDGSHSVRGQYDSLRKVGATARVMLVAAAAKRWHVPESACEARDHAVFHSPSKRSLGFGDLAEDAARIPIPKKDVPLRPLAELRHAGKDLPLLDAPAITTGRAVFAADVRLPGMLTAVVLRCPVPGGKVLHHDPARALAVAGVKKVVLLPPPTKPFGFHPLGGLAVVAADTWSALRGRKALEVTWDGGDNRHYDSVAFTTTLASSVAAPGRVARNVGDVEAALARSVRKVEAEYHVPHLAHAPMEPPCAVARFDGDRCEIWACTQNPQAARTEVAKALGVDESKVTVHVTLLGGGFGRKSKPDYVVEAALVAKEVGAPVRLQWSREDDLQHDYYHTVSAQHLVAGIDDAGKVVAWRHRTAYPPIPSTFSGATFSEKGELQQGVLDAPLHIPNVRAENCEARAYARIGWLRSVANIYHAFAVQSFIDEIAAARGKDPKENLLEIIGPPRIVKPAELGVDAVPNYGQSLDEHPIDTARHRRVIERVTEISAWADRKKSRRALGLAVHRSFLSYIAVVVSVLKNPDGRIKVDEAWIVGDAGTLVNPERVRSQLEGAVVFGLGHALYGAITMKNGATEQPNFRDYRLIRIAEAPRAIHVDLIRSEGPPGGVGEPGVPPVAPALTNAIFALTGTRVRTLPIVRTLPV